MTISRDLTRATFTRDGRQFAVETVDPAYRDPQLLRKWVQTMQGMGYAVATELPETPRQTAARLLETAAGLVALGWTRDANARLADSTPCSPESPAAACWCAMGALTAASHELGIHTERDGYQDLKVPGADYKTRLRIMGDARIALREAIKERLHPNSLSAVSVTLSITNWNDDEADSGDVVARTMKRAAAILRDAA